MVSINALYQLVQKDAFAMSKVGGDNLVEDLFGMLDDDQHPMSVQGARNVISSWLKQTVVLNPSAWIDLCQRIMAKATASQQVADAAANHHQQQQGLKDDEGESLYVSSGDDNLASSAGGEVLEMRGEIGDSRQDGGLNFSLYSVCMKFAALLPVAKGRNI